MNCNESRELIGGDPQHLPAELQEHLSTCSACREYRDQMLALDAKLQRAMNFEVRLAGRPPFEQALPRANESNVINLAQRRSGGKPARRGLGVGIGLAAGLLLAFTLWLSRPQPALAMELVQHVEGEPDSWKRTKPVSAEEVAAVLRHSGVELREMPEPVVYASSCLFRGNYVPHFVVMTHSGPVTVMILTHQPVKAREEFHSDGFSGLLLPVQGGSIAVLSQHPMQLDQPAAEMVRALEGK